MPESRRAIAERVAELVRDAREAGLSDVELARLFARVVNGAAPVTVAKTPARKAPPATFGSRLQAARLAAGLTQIELAIAAEVSPSAVHAWEHDTQTPVKRNLRALCRVLHVKPEDLTG